MYRVPRILTLASILTIAACSPQQKHALPDLARADSIVASAIEDQMIPGAVLLIAKDSEVVFHKAYGFAESSSEPPQLMTPEHIFDLASVTKVLATTLSVMVLVDEKRIDLDAPVKTYLPDFSGVSKDSITVRHLLTHTSGLHQWKPIYYHAQNPAEARAYISQLDLGFAVGEARHYSDLGFMLLGYIVEEVSGQPLDEFAKTRLYEPLGLIRTGFKPDIDQPIAATSFGNPFEKKMVADDSFGYVCDEDPDSFIAWRTHVLRGEVNDGNSYYAHGGVAGHAGLFSTADEVATLLALVRNSGSYRGKELISPATVNIFLSTTESGNGLGWAMNTGVLNAEDLPVGSFGHSGFTGTYALSIPTHDLEIVLLTNRQNFGVDSEGGYPSVSDLRRKVVEAVLTSYFE